MSDGWACDAQYTAKPGVNRNSFLWDSPSAGVAPLFVLERGGVLTLHGDRHTVAERSIGGEAAAEAVAFVVTEPNGLAQCGGSFYERQKRAQS